MKKKNYALIPIIAIAFIIIISIYKKTKESTEENYIRKTIIISDTILNITAQTSEKKMNNLTDLITNEINRIDNIINPYNQKSEIAIVNKKSLEGIKEIEISKELSRIFETGLKYSRLNPSFDITVRGLIELWGFGIKENQTVPTAKEIGEALENIDYSKLNIITNEDKIFLKLKKNLTFDFGAYGKGYIITKLIEIFKSENIENFLIDYGGDTYANGVNRKGEAWVIAIRNPIENLEENSEKFLALIKSTNYAIVTSGDYERYFTENGTNYHHIIDAKTGYPSYNSISATIVHTNSEEADALSTIAFLMGTNFFTNENFKYKEAYILTPENELFIVTNNDF
ncbi:FAD:protein FMN transferase [Brachyspira sp.]|uniref:FAD:protein FMN transferase n=1 Tax=Brachyspira sp. TaxID=1977261 RepID=UPI003D7DA390